METIDFEGETILIKDDVRKKLIELKQKSIELNLLEQKLKEEIMTVMSSYEGANLKDDLIIAKFKKGTTRTTIDSKKLKEELPDIFEEYSKISNVSGSISLEYLI